VFDLLCHFSCRLAGIQNFRKILANCSTAALPFVIEVEVGISSCAKFHHSTSIQLVSFRGLYGKIKTDVAPCGPKCWSSVPPRLRTSASTIASPCPGQIFPSFVPVIGDPALGKRLRRQQFHADATAGVAEGVTFRVGNQFRHDQPQPPAALGIHSEWAFPRAEARCPCGQAWNG
jgi:hypothetical protein